MLFLRFARVMGLSLSGVKFRKLSGALMLPVGPFGGESWRLRASLLPDFFAGELLNPELIVETLLNDSERSPSGVLPNGPRRSFFSDLLQSSQTMRIVTVVKRGVKT